MKTTAKTFWRKHYIEFSPMVIQGEAGQGPVAKTCNYTTLEALAMGHKGTRDERYAEVTEIEQPLSPEASADLVAEGAESLRKSDEQAQREADEAEFTRLAEKLGKEVV